MIFDTTVDAPPCLQHRYMHQYHDLDEAVRIVNNFYRVYRDRLVVLEDNEVHINSLIKEVNRQ